MDKRIYLLMTAKHASKTHPLFWGYRTKSDEPRSFGGYTPDYQKAELYTMDEILSKFGAIIPAEPINTTLPTYNMLPIENDNLEIQEFSDTAWNNQPDDEERLVFVIPYAAVQNRTETTFTLR
ncbi:hypothetical protein [Lactiplantibacillus daowaiensis]|uniref:Uncharacterized protein n=1 Tax=Lactiplantibacillus daowaiensis TaxID=2559918 RepID=A0ABW1RY17_9LACO|nr:hypothetical protein [Lactiplantibacillus daowaiensis]